MDLLDPFSCQLHHIAFDRLKSHIPLPCPGTQSINTTLKLHCVFFILNFTIANTVISKKSYFRLNIWWDVIYVQREQQGTKNGALGDTRQNPSPVRFYSIYNNSLLSEAKKRIYPFQCLATDSIAKQFAFKEFMRPSCWHQNVGPNVLSAPAQGLYTCRKSWKCLHKIRGHS